MFNHFGVNTLSAFRALFQTHQLRPGPVLKGCRSKPALLLPAPWQRAGDAQWHLQSRGEELYIGELCNGQRHGRGLLLCQASGTWHRSAGLWAICNLPDSRLRLAQGARSKVLYVGQFAEGQRNGFGVATSSQGERLEGRFLDDVPWGPACFTFAPCSAAQPGHRVRVRYEGIMNGRPMGKGCMLWSEGTHEWGQVSSAHRPQPDDGAPCRSKLSWLPQFDGYQCLQRLDEDDVAGVLSLCAATAGSAREAEREAREAALQQAHVADQVQRMLDEVALRDLKA